MITLTIIFVFLLVSAVMTLLTGGLTILVFGDGIVALWVLYKLIKKIIDKKKEN